MVKIKSKNIQFDKDCMTIIRKEKQITINYMDIEKIIYIKNSLWNWLTGRTHAVVPGRIHVFLKSDNGKDRYSLKIPNSVFDHLPAQLLRKLPNKYKNY